VGKTPPGKKIQKTTSAEGLRKKREREGKPRDAHSNQPGVNICSSDVKHTAPAHRQDGDTVKRGKGDKKRVRAYSGNFYIWVLCPKLLHKNKSREKAGR